MAKGTPNISYLPVSLSHEIQSISLHANAFELEAIFRKVHRMTPTLHYTQKANGNLYIR